MSREGGAHGIERRWGTMAREYGSSSAALAPDGEKGVDLSYQYDEVEELLATDAAFQRRHRHRTLLTRGLVAGLVALTLLALYAHNRVSSKDLSSAAMAASDQGVSFLCVSY